MSTKINPRRISKNKGVNLRCVSCYSKKNLTIDHIIPKSEGGSNIMSNYQIMCRSCNSKKGSNITHKPDNYISYSDMIVDIHDRYSKGVAKHIVKFSITGRLGDVMSIKNYNLLTEYLHVYGIHLVTNRKVVAPVGADRSYPKMDFNFDNKLLLNRYVV